MPITPQRSYLSSPKKHKVPRFLHTGQLWTYDGDIVDKLTDSSLYTGTHKYRFDEHGNGVGKEGRDAARKGVGHSIGNHQSCGGIDTDSSNWQTGLRSSFYHAGPRKEPGGSRRRSRSSQGRKALVPRYEAWKVNSLGQTVKDEELTYMWQHGPDRFKFEEVEVARNRERRRLERERNLAEDCSRIDREQHDLDEAQAPVEIFYVDECGNRCKDATLSNLWQYHQDKQYLDEIEARLGIPPDPSRCFPDNPELEVERRWEAVRHHLDSTNNSILHHAGSHSSMPYSSPQQSLAPSPISSAPQHRVQLRYHQ
eukprot:TRINITY_DN31566_c0_g1_i1.p1 TRINITY_DN31566_c0_g1~~TRINITY_DN31566_c0_g1_i1.p1  ORF type:complete len:324 (+),score=61.06 TRINITY_DN31566_c0_g1_i1:41-973(+)